MLIMGEYIISLAYKTGVLEMGINGTCLAQHKWLLNDQVMSRCAFWGTSQGRPKRYIQDTDLHEVGGL